jgi:TonB family protein
LNQKILGTWLPDPKYHQNPPSKSTYHSDGSLKFVAYISEKCEYKMSAAGHWFIRDNMLHAFIEQSTNTDLLPVGLEIIDEIISITSTHKILKAADNGELQYRLKGDICTQSTSIKNQSKPSYAERIRAQILPHIVVTEPIDGNPSAEMEVRTTPDGSIIGAKLIKSSGSQHWDAAVQRAVARAERIPLDIDGKVPAVLIITFQPKL